MLFRSKATKGKKNIYGGDLSHFITGAIPLFMLVGVLVILLCLPSLALLIHGCDYTFLIFYPIKGVLHIWAREGLFRLVKCTKELSYFLFFFRYVRIPLIPIWIHSFHSTTWTWFASLVAMVLLFSLFFYFSGLALFFFFCFSFLVL